MDKLKTGKVHSVKLVPFCTVHYPAMHGGSKIMFWFDIKGKFFQANNILY